jgi:hypothetical protein
MTHGSTESEAQAFFREQYPFPCVLMALLTLAIGDVAIARIHGHLPRLRHGGSAFNPEAAMRTITTSPFAVSLGDQWETDLV